MQRAYPLSSKVWGSGLGAEASGVMGICSRSLYYILYILFYSYTGSKG